MRRALILLTLLAFLPAATAQSLKTGDECCIRCSCLYEAQCLSCGVCEWTAAGCTPSDNYEVYDCCVDCTCESPGECISCGCCVDDITLKCYPPPCETTTTQQYYCFHDTLAGGCVGDCPPGSSCVETGDFMCECMPDTTTTFATTTTRPLRTTTTSTTTLFQYPHAGELYTTTSTTSTTSTSTTSTTTSTTTTTTIPEPGCFDGRQNQGEEWIDCGGPCRPCTLPDVSVVVENPGRVDRGDLFNVRVRLNASWPGSYGVDIRLPEGFEGRDRTVREVTVDDSGGAEFDLDVDATDDVDEGEYKVRVDVRDNRRLHVASNSSNVTVEEPFVIETPVARIKLPTVRELGRRFKDVQEKLFNIVNNTTEIIYSSGWLWAFLLLALMGTAYLYYAWRRSRA